MTGTGAEPIVMLAGQSARVLQRLERTHRHFDERSLQKMLAETPQLLPVRQIRPDAGDLICIGREVPVGCGAVDNLYLSTSGYPVVVEMKLWRNPQSRREVLSQTLDYVKEIVRKDYEWLARQFDSYRKGKASEGSLFERVKAATKPEEMDESQFIDRVNGALSRGDVIAMIVGDGIETGLQELVSHLCRDSAHLRYSLALVELACYPMGSENDGLLVVPRIVRDVEPVQRAYVRIDVADGLREKIVVTPQAEEREATNKRKRRLSLSEEEFWDRLATESGGAERDEIRSLVDDLIESFPLAPEFKTESLLLKAAVRKGKPAKIALIGIRSNGGLFNPQTMPGSLSKFGLGKETVKNLKSGYWAALNQIDNQFLRNGIRIQNGTQFVPFDALRDKLPAIKTEIGNAIAQIQQAYEARNAQ